MAIDGNRRARGPCLFAATAFVAAGNFADVFGAGRAHALRRLIGDHDVMHRLRAFSVSISGNFTSSSPDFFPSIFLMAIFMAV